MPTSGTATYDGKAAGAYASRYGTDVPAVPQGSHELGEYAGDLTLIANFGTANISGWIHNIALNGVLVTPQGQTAEFDVDSDYQLHLGATSFTADGTFSGTDVTVTHPAGTLQSEGSWGGKFSTIDTAAGNPRLVAGTTGGTATAPSGSTASFVGGFYGATGQRRR